MATLQNQSPQKWGGHLARNTQIGRYKIIGYLSKGLQAECYVVLDIKNGKEYAMKLGKNIKPKLQHEMKYINQLNNSPSPYFLESHEKMVRSYKGTKNHFIVMERGGQNWSQQRKLQPALCYPPIQAAQMGIEMIYILEELHGRGIVHRDIKPTNVVFKRRGKWKYHSSLIDFDTADDAKSKQKGFTGTTLFASPNIHNGGSYTPQDDVISAIYLIMLLTNGALPWQSIIEQYKHQQQVKRQKVLRMKEDFNDWVMGKGAPARYQFGSEIKNLIKVANKHRFNIDYGLLRYQLRFKIENEIRRPSGSPSNKKLSEYIFKCKDKKFKFELVSIFIVIIPFIFIHTMIQI